MDYIKLVSNCDSFSHKNRFLYKCSFNKRIDIYKFLISFIFLCKPFTNILQEIHKYTKGKSFLFNKEKKINGDAEILINKSK